MTQDEHTLGTSTYRGISLEIIEAKDGDLTIASHKPFSNQYTCSIPADLVRSLVESQTYGPFMMMLTCLMQIMVNRDLDTY